MLCLCSYGESYYIREANRYYALGELEKAIACCDKALARNPGNYDVYIDKGILCQELGEEDEAIRIFSEAMVLSPGEADAYECRAESYMRIAKYAAALDDCNRALKIVAGSETDFIRVVRVHHEFFPVAPTDVYSLYADRAVACYYLDSMKLALNDLNLCIGHAKELAHCYYGRGYVDLKMNKPRAAHEDLKRAASPGYSEAGSDFGK